MFVLLFVGLYLLGTGPALWSRTRFAERGWNKGVIYYVAPLMWLNHQFRNRSTIEKLGGIDPRPSNKTRWYGWFESYWSLYGAETLSESRKVNLMLKIRFYGE